MSALFAFWPCIIFSVAELKLYKTRLMMKSMKNNIFIRKNSEGFVFVFLVLLLPTLMALLAIIFQLVFFTEFRNEFRFMCINESLAIQKELSLTKTGGLIRANDLLEKLKKIKSPYKYYVSLSDYPKYESENPANTDQSLVYRLNYSWLSNDHLTSYLICGIRLKHKVGQWQYETVYSTSVDKF